MGRPPLYKDEENDGIYVRFSRAERELFQQMAQQWEISIPEVIRRIIRTVGLLQAELNQRDVELDELAQHYLDASNTDERASTFTRLLMARAQTATYESAMELFLRECPRDINALMVRRLLEKYRIANTKNPGSVTDADLGFKLGFGRCSSATNLIAK